MIPAPKTILDVLKAGTDYLTGKDIEQPRLACELLLSRLLPCKRLELSLRYQTVLTTAHIQAMRRGVKRVADGEPVQYVLGQADFMGHTFKVDRRALIPRPETEVLVGHVLDCEPLWQKSEPVIADIGTGTGCMIISIALERPDGLYVGLDIDKSAIELASENAATFGFQDKIVFAAVELCDFVDAGALDAIVANLPYIPSAEIEKLPIHIRNHEPRTALDGGPEGLSVIESVILDASIALKPGGFLFLEIGEKQGNAVTSLLKDGGFHEITIKQDLACRDRVVRGLLAE